MILRIGQIEYANCFPFFKYLQDAFPDSGYLFTKGIPTKLNAMLSSGQLDVSPSSSIEYAKRPQEYLVLNNLSVSSIGPVRSVSLFSRLPIENLDMKRVLLSAESDTSVNLLKIILRKFYGYRNSFETAEASNIEAALTDFPAVLLIGDSALRQNIDDLDGIYRYDLGELWYRYTRLPFVFALWIVRQETVTKCKPEVLTLYDQLHEAGNMLCNSFTDFASSFGKSWIDEEQLVSYWKSISYALTEYHLEGLRAFYRFSAELGLIEKEPEIRLFPR